MKKWFSASIISALLIYGVFGAVFTASDLGPVWDEPLYKTAGLIYLEQHRFDENHDHPPLSKWIAALYPYYSGDHRNEAFRYSHIAIFGFGGAIIAFSLLSWGFEIGSIVFSFLYFLCPNLKAMASLNVLDADISILMGLLGLYCWRGFTEKVSGRMGLLQGIAAMTKITALIYVPFFSFRVWKLQSKAAVKISVVGFLTAMLIAYHFKPQEFGWYAASLGLQLKHSHIGQKIFILGKTSQYGFWFTYIVLFFLKNTVPTIALILLGFLLVIRSWKKYTEVLVYLIAPALMIFCLLSLGSVQLGMRYLLPSMVLFYISTAIVLDTEMRKLENPLFKRASGLVFIFLGGFLIQTDVHQLKSDTYINYFNSFASNPTRNFCDSNNDWQQGIPRHLLADTGSHISVPELSAFRFLSTQTSDPIRLEVGASDYCAAWIGWRPNEELGPLLKAFGPPVWEGGGYEILELKPVQLFSVWAANDQSGILSGWSARCQAPRSLGVTFGPGVEANSLSQILVTVHSESEPQISRSSVHFKADGAKEDQNWRAWMTSNDLKKGSFNDSSGKPISSERIKMGAVVCN